MDKKGVFFCLVFTIVSCSAVHYTPDWKSIDSRPLPSWYDKAKIGIFLHWGVFSVPAFGNEWFWYNWKAQNLSAYQTYMQQNYKPNFSYADFAPMFTAEFYDPNRWADIFNASGANYVVLVTKHHEGFTNWPSNYSWNWNALDVGPKRDLVGDLATAIRAKTKIHFGVYHSLFEWFHPLYLQDKANGFRTNNFVLTKTLPELYELVNTYKPDIIWSDGSSQASDDYFQSKEFLAWLYNESPVKDTVVVNDRWGNATSCRHGGFWNCRDQYNPGSLMSHKWESCIKLDKKSWGYRHDANLQDILTIEEVILLLARTVSYGGNLLINVGPTKDGLITPVYEERLRQLGQWLQVNGEAIYGTRPWTHQNDTINPNVWYTAKTTSDKGVSVYAIFLKWPESEPELFLGVPVVLSRTNVTLLGYDGYLPYKPGSPAGVSITLPVIPVSQLSHNWGWVLRLEGLAN